MSLFGKVLLFLNVIVVIGFLFVAAIDYARREAWSDNYAQHDLAIVGIPLDDKEADARNNVRVENLRKPAVEKLVGSPFVKTQAEELERVKAKVKEGVKDALDDGLLQGLDQAPPDEAQKRREQFKAASRRLVGLLTALADTQNRREQLAIMAARIDRAPADTPYLAGFQLTDRSLAALLADGVPQQTLDKLTNPQVKDVPSLKDRDFATEKQFTDELAKVLGPDEIQQWQPKLVERARLRPQLAAELDEKFANALEQTDPSKPGQKVPLTLEQKKLNIADLLFRLAVWEQPYKLTKESLDGLPKLGVPQQTAAKLAPMVDQQYPNESAFLDEAAKVLAPTELQQARGALLTAARQKLRDQPAYNRFVNVVGVSMASRAVDHYAMNLKQGAQEVGDAIEQDRGRFLLAYRSRLAAIQTLKDQVAQLEATQKEQENLLDARRVAVNENKRKIAQLQDELKAEQARAAALLRQQQFIEDSLARSRQELRDAFAENERLEQLLRTYEQAR